MPCSPSLQPLSSAEPSNGLRRRLVRGLGATALAPLVTAFIQLGPVPILLHAWGAAKYGDWLILSALPAYLSLSDLGFGTASGSDMTVRVAAGDRKGALQTFQSSWLLLTVVSVLVLLVVSTTIWWIPWQRWLKLSSLSSFDAASVMLTLGVYSIVAQQAGVLESGYRCDGNFATGTLCGTILRLIEAVVGTAVAVVGQRSLLAVAFAYLAVRAIGTVAYGLLLHRLSPWLTFGFRHAQLKTIRELWTPALGFMAMPIGNALSFQGFTVVVGSVLGPTMVVAFSTMRTLTRVSCQLLTVVARVLWPELSSAFGAGNVLLARRLHRYACQLGLAMSFLTGILLWIIGPYAYRVWVRHSVVFDRACFGVLLVDVLASSLWLTSSIVPMSTNVHQRMALAYLAGTSFSLALAWVLIHPYGNLGAALSLLASEAWMCWFVLPMALRQVDDTAAEFVSAMFRVPRLG